jgi:hypothetical protein
MDPQINQLDPQAETLQHLLREIESLRDRLALVETQQQRGRAHDVAPGASLALPLASFQTSRILDDWEPHDIEAVV